MGELDECLSHVLPGREERTLFQRDPGVLEDHAALPSLAGAPGLLVCIRAVLYGAHLEKPQQKQVCWQNEAATSLVFCSFSDLVEPSAFLNEK